jgi:hypothetical protein
MENETTPAVQLHTHRPMFLTILCIIGFLGSLVGVVHNAMGIFDAANKSKENIAMVNAKIIAKDPDAEKKGFTLTNNSSNLNEENFFKFYIGGVFASLLTLVGCFFMWKLKRTGFYSFSLGTFFNVITLLLLFGPNVLNSGNFLYAAIAGVLILILFATQLKNEDD